MTQLLSTIYNNTYQPKATITLKGKRILLSVILVILSFRVLAEKPCQSYEQYHNWQEAQKACQLLIDEMPSHSSEFSLAEQYYHYSKIAYDFKQYQVAQGLLLELEYQFPELLNNQNQELHFDWLYLMGRINVRLNNLENGLFYFQKTLNTAKTLSLPIRDKKVAYALNAIGLTHKKMNQFHKALSSYRESLIYKKKQGPKVAIAKTLSNIANIYSLLEDYDNALKYYLEANDYYLASNQLNHSLQVSLSHGYENIGIVYNQLKQYQHSIQSLKNALDSYPQGQENDNKTKIYTYLADSYLKQKQFKLANDYFQMAFKEDIKHKVHNAFLRLGMARYFHQKGQLNTAIESLNEGIIYASHGKQNQETLSQLYLLKSEIQKSQNNFESAISNLSKYHNIREQILSNKFNQDIKNISYQIEIEKNQHDLQLLAKENQLKAIEINRQYWVIFSFVLIAFVSSVYLRKIFQRKHTEKQRLLREISTHKQQLHKMENSKEQLKALFKDTADAILCVDSGWSIAFHNEQFNQLFKNNNDQIEGQKLNEILPDLFHLLNDMPVDHNDMLKTNVIRQFPIDIASERSNVDIRINTINLLDDFTVLSVGNSSALIKNLNQNDQTIDHIINNLSVNKNLNESTLNLLKTELQKDLYSDALSKKADADFRGSLVKLMRDSVDIWSAHTRTNRIELADVSGYWKVTIDDGRLRTRAMDRYLKVKQLPKNPRWRQVVKTAHYILSECDLSASHRQTLKQSLDHFMSIINDH